MAKQKLSELTAANSVSHSDITYLVQSGVSKSTNIKTILNSVSTSNITEGSNLYFTNTRARGAFVPGSGITIESNGLIISTASATLANITSDNIPEGSNNQYYSTSKQYGAYRSGLGIFADVANGLISTNAILTINSIQPNPISGAFSLYTDNIIEASNVFYSNARVYANVIGLLNAKANRVDLVTSNVVEGTNLYYTNARVYANIAPLLANLQSNIAAVATIANNATNSNITLSLSNHTTSNLAEGSNLYFSNARAILASIPAVTQLVVTTPVFNYNIDSYSGDNPGIYVHAGTTLSFDLQVGASHPFVIRESNGGANITNNLTHVAPDGTTTTGSSAQGKINGKLFWKIPFSYAGNTVVYQCTAHSSMVGNINVLNPTMSGNGGGGGNGVGGTVYLPGEGISINASNTISTLANLENYTFYVSAAGGPPSYVINANNNPVLTLYKGRTYKFEVNAAGHPFFIQSTPAPYNANTLYTKGVRNNGAQLGNIYLTVSDDTPNLYYVCQVHPFMTSTLFIRDPAGAIDLTTSNVTEGANLYFTNTRARSAWTQGAGIVIESNGMISANATTLLSANADVSFNNISANSFISTGAGTPTLRSNTNINLTANNAVVITSSVLRLRSYTLTERLALSPSNGDLIYNTTNNKVQAFVAGAWTDL